MTTIIDLVVIVIACLAVYLVYGATEQALRHLCLGSPRVISLAVAMLTLLAILELGRGIILLLLIPYAALGITLLTLYLLNIYRIRMPSSGVHAVRSAQLFLQGLYRTCASRARQLERNWRNIHNRK